MARNGSNNDDRQNCRCQNQGEQDSRSQNQNQDDQKMSREEAGRLGGLAPHECRGFGCPRQAGSMSPEEAGRLGGLAPHECRGQECNEDSSNDNQGSNINRNR